MLQIAARGGRGTAAAAAQSYCEVRRQLLSHITLARRQILCTTMAALSAPPAFPKAAALPGTKITIFL